MNMLAKLLPQEEVKLRLVAILLSAVVGGLLTLLIIYGIRSYGIVLFFLVPAFLGFGSTVIYGLKKPIAFRRGFEIGFYALIVYCAGLIIGAFEGLICIAMVMPIAVLLMVGGVALGLLITRKLPGTAPGALLLLMGMIPLLAFAERQNEPTLSKVQTSVVIDADPQTVWDHLIGFSEMAEPEELLFKVGIAYPIRAEIEGNGVGAVRYCNFSTGSFVEPITVWDEPHRLAFDVEEVPEPMKELHYWDIDAPHLHDYFISKQGQFQLTALPDGRTQLEGTTWYEHNIYPEFYWRIWSDYIVHKIHDRVLNHIKRTSESSK